MMESSENMDRYFRDKLENYSESPPQDTWDKIADSLGHRQKRKMVFFISRIAAGITILISLSVLFFYTQKEKSGEVAIQSNTISSIKTYSEEPNQVQISKEPDGQTRHFLTESGKSGKESRERAAYNGVTNIQTSRQTDQTSSITEEEMLSKSSSVEDMTSAYFPVADKLNYLIPRACNYLKADNSADDQAIPVRNSPTGGQAGKLSTDQLLAFVDEENIEKERQTAWLIGAQFAPLYSYRSLTSEKYQDYVREQINSKESGVLAYAGGINLTVSPNKRLSVQSGLYYSVYGQEKNSLEAAIMVPNPTSYTLADNTEFYTIDSKEQIQAVYVGNSTGKIMAFDESLSGTQSPSYRQADQSMANQLNSAIPVSSVTQYFEYLEIPVNLKYKIMDKKFDVSLMGGVSTNFLIGTDIQLNYADNSSKNTDYITEGLNRINYSSLMGIGFEYPLFKNLILNVEPKFRYYLNSINKEQVYDIRPYSIGIFSGISYLF